MVNFVAYNPVKLLFGKGMIAEIGKEIPAGTTVMVAYGGGSIKKNGVYDQVRQALAAYPVVEFAGIEPNPHYETCMRAAALCREKGVGFILAVGGGSVLDAVKFIAVAAVYDAGDPWAVMEGGAPISAALPLGSVMTLPATGSEMNTFAVISRESTNEKLAFGSPHVYPKFSVLDPETTFSLPMRQVENGIVDTFVHVMEQYMCRAQNTPLTARMAEGVLQTLVEEAPKVKADPLDYEVRANLMWCATVGLNGWLGYGVEMQDWATHMIGHELTALYGLDHARTLAIVMPAVHRFQLARKQARLAQYGARVWGLCTGAEAERAAAAVDRTEAFFKSVGLETRLSACGIDAVEAGRQVAERLAARGRKIGEYGDIGAEEVRAILMLAQ